MNAALFYSSVRSSLFGGSLSASQVSGMDAILAAVTGMEIRWQAYSFATAFHETARTMQPIREYGRGWGKAYGTTYYGRGLVQLTWKLNYQKMGDLLGVDLLTHPDLALSPDIASKIMVQGMRGGVFTGRSLATYFNAVTDDPLNARRIINGTDCAALIAGYHAKFLAALKAANSTEVST